MANLYTKFNKMSATCLPLVSPRHCWCESILQTPGDPSAHLCRISCFWAFWGVLISSHTFHSLTKIPGFLLLHSGKDVLGGEGCSTVPQASELLGWRHDRDILIWRNNGKKALSFTMSCSQYRWLLSGLIQRQPNCSSAFHPANRTCYHSKYNKIEFHNIRLPVM